MKAGAEYWTATAGLVTTVWVTWPLTGLHADHSPTLTVVTLPAGPRLPAEVWLRPLKALATAPWMSSPERTALTRFPVSTPPRGLDLATRSDH